MASLAVPDFREPEFWDRLVLGGPAQALLEARRLLATAAVDPDVAALAHGAACRSLFELGLLPESQREARVAMAASAFASRPELQWSIAMSAAVVLAEGGQVEEGLAALEGLAEQSDGVHLGRVRLQMAYVLHHAGRLTDAIKHLDLSERIFVTGGEQRDRVRVHLNRGLVLLQQGRLGPAEDDFVIAEAIAQSIGMTTYRAQCMANLGVLHGRARHLSRSMRCFETAARLFAEVGNPARTVAIMEIDRAEVMMHSGLVSDAVSAARTAVALAAPGGNKVVFGDAQLLLARAELAAGRLRDAIRSAEYARVVLTSSGRHNMIPHARSVGAHAVLQGVEHAAAAEECIVATGDIVDGLRTAGWNQQADELMIARVRAGHRFGLYALIADDLDHLRLGAWSSQRDLALIGWYAEAIGRGLSDDQGSALDACRSGLDRLDDIVAEADTLERRSAAMRLGEDLSQLAIDLAVEQGNAGIVFAAAEGTRARALHDELVESERHKPLSAELADQLRRELSVRLGNRVLIEWVFSGSRTWAVVFDQSGSRLVDVGDTRTILRARDRVLVWLDRASAEPDGSSRNAIHGAALLDDLVIAPLEIPANADVVLVPVGGLHGIPWSGLPSLVNRSVTLAPNAQLWLESDRRAGGSGRTVGLIVGPGVESVEVERVAVERNHPGAAIASGAGATAAVVRSMFAGFDLVHVAAHGVFRSDHPLMSTMRLHDGEMTLYDTVPDRVRSRLIVLSSCEGGAQGTADGSEVLGLASVMLARGAAAVLAPLTVVRDLECADFVAEVHGELAAGLPFGRAVSVVRQRWLSDDDLSRWAVASSFTCFGSGAVTIESH